MHPQFSITSTREAKDPAALLHELCAIDAICFGDIAQEDQGSPAYWEIIDKATYTQVIFDNDKAIGYIDFLRLSNKGIKALECGDVRDGQLEALADTARGEDENKGEGGISGTENGESEDKDAATGDLTAKSNSKANTHHHIHLYLISICLLPEYRGLGLGQRLWNASRDYCIKHQIKVDSIYATIWTEEGQHYLSRIARHNAPAVIAKDMHGHSIVKIKTEDGELPLMLRG